MSFLLTYFYYVFGKNLYLIYVNWFVWRNINKFLYNSLYYSEWGIIWASAACGFSFLSSQSIPLHIYVPAKQRGERIRAREGRVGSKEDDIKGGQAWEFFARVFCTKRTHLGMWLRVWGKKSIFYQMTPVFDGFLFFAAYWVCGKPKKKFEARPKLKVGGGCFWAHCMPTMPFSKKI